MERMLAWMLDALGSSCGSFTNELCNAEEVTSPLLAYFYIYKIRHLNSVNSNGPSNSDIL